jgi:hypothetical protein
MLRDNQCKRKSEKLFWNKSKFSFLKFLLKATLLPAAPKLTQRMKSRKYVVGRRKEIVLKFRCWAFELVYNCKEKSTLNYEQLVAQNSASLKVTVDVLIVIGNCKSKFGNQLESWQLHLQCNAT